MELKTAKDLLKENWNAAKKEQPHIFEYDSLFEDERLLIRNTIREYASQAVRLALEEVEKQVPGTILNKSSYLSLADGIIGKLK